MEPVTTIGLAVCAVAGFLSGGVAGVALTKRFWGSEAELRNQLSEARGERDRLEFELRSETKERERYQLWYDHACKERDRFSEIASSHEIKMPENPEEGPFWKERLFSNHPEKNLENMKNELYNAGLLDKEVDLHVEVLGSTLGGASGFSQAISKTWTRNGKPTKDIGPWEFNGTAARALEDLEAFLRDDNTGLMKRGEKKWIDDDSPLVFKVSIDILEPINPKPPEPQIVEVAVIKTEREIVEVEKPVFISVPEGQEAELCGHTQEEIRALVKDEIQKHNAEAEIESLGNLGGMDLKEELARLAAQKRAKKQGA